MSRANRPASSRQAQEYLTSAASGFGAASNAFAAFAAFTPAAGTDTDAQPSQSQSVKLRSHYDAPDADINLCLKKLGKRDPITKLKALDELTHLFTARPSVISASLPAFFHCYHRLAADNDRRVREQLYQPMTVIVNHNKKDLAPYVKHAFPYWYCHCHDTVKEVTKAANDAFRLAFPTADKQSQVLRFAKSEFVNSVSMLLSCKPESLSDMAVTTPEQAEERYARMVASALTSLADYITTTTTTAITPTNTDTSNDDYIPLYGSALKLLTSKRSLIRRSCYQLLTMLIQSQPAYIHSQLSSLSSVIVDSLTDTDKSNHSAVWDVLLKLSQSEPTFTDYVNESDWSRLFTMIQKANYGSSTLLYHNALPLLATLSTSVTTPTFLSLFFDALFRSRLSLGMGLHGVYSGSVDMSACFLCFVECSLYIVVSRKSMNSGISASVLDEALLPTVRHLLVTSEPFNSTTVLQSVAKALTVIDRHINDSNSDQSLRSLPLSFRLTQLVETAIEKAEAASGNDDNVASSSVIWTRIETLLSLMHQERTRRADTSTNSELLDAIAASAIDRAHLSFERSFTLAAIQLATTLTSTFTITNIAKHSQHSSPSQFIHYLLTVVEKFIQSHSTTNQDTADSQSFQQSINALMTLLASVIAVCDTDTAHHAFASIASILCESAPFTEDGTLRSSITVHLIAVHAFVANVAVQSSATSYDWQTVFDDEALNLVEHLLSAETTADHRLLTTNIQALLPLLAMETRLAIIDSLVDSLSTFLSLMPRFVSTIDPSIISRLEAQSGAKVASVPAIFVLVSPLITQSQALDAMISDSEKRQAIIDTITTAVFFSQFLNIDNVSSEARAVWQSLAQVSLDAVSQSLRHIAALFHQSLMTESFNSMTSEWILRWSDQAAKLITSIAPAAAQSIIDTMLPSHSEFQSLIISVSADDAERLRIVRDCLGELVTTLGASVLVDNSDGNQRSWLAVDMAAVRAHLTLFTQHSHASSAHNSHALIQSAFRSSSVVEAALQRLISESLSTGGAYSDALASWWSHASDNNLELSDASILFTRRILLPLAGLSSEGTLPSSMTALLQPLSSSLAKTLTPSFTTTIEAFLPAPGLKDSQLDALLRVCTDVLERVRGNASKGSDDAALASCLMVVIATTVGRISEIPAWFSERVTPLIASLTLPRTVDSATLVRYHRARIILATIEMRQLSSLVTQAGAFTEAGWILSLKRTVAWLDDSLRAALAVSEPTPHSLAFLSDAVTMLAPLVTSLLTTVKAPADVDMLSSTRLLYQLVSSPVINAITVTRFESTIVTMLSITLTISRTAPDALASLTERDFTRVVPLGTDVTRSPAINCTSPVTRLFTLLSHPFPAVACCAYELVSLACLHRAVIAAIEFDDERESFDEVKQTISEEEKVTNNGNSVSEEQALREAERRRRRRLAREQRRLRDRINTLVPEPLQFVLEQRLELDSSEDSVFNDRSMADQLRGHLLCSAVVFDMFDSRLPLSNIALNENKRGLLLAYLRSYDLVAPVLNETLQHLIVASDDSERQSLMADARAKQWTISPAMLEPRSPSDSVDSKPIASFHRLAALYRRQSHYVDDCVFYPSLCFGLYLRLLHCLPVLARAWYTNADRTSASIISKHTAQYLSPLLIAIELREVDNDASLTDNDTDGDDDVEVRIKTDISQALVSARYTRGDVSLGLTLRLSNIHPLQPTTVDFTDGVRLSQQWLRKWQVSITAALSASNGSVAAAISGWKENLDKHLSGVSECSICMSVVNPQNHSLPKLKCQQCQHFFHSLCIYTWFEKSGNSTCPLCRTPF